MKRKIGRKLWLLLRTPRKILYVASYKHPNRIVLRLYFTIDRWFDSLGDAYIWK